jgi:hypothetical protein
MRPIETQASDTTYVGGEGVDDLPTEVGVELDPQSGTILRRMRSRWRPDELERSALILGADVVLDVFGSAMPPVRVRVTAPATSLRKATETVDSVISVSIAYTIASVLADLGVKRSIEDIRAWSDDDRRAVSTWLAEHPGPDDAVELDLWRNRAPLEGLLP